MPCCIPYPASKGDDADDNVNDDVDDGDDDNDDVDDDDGSLSRHLAGRGRGGKRGTELEPL